MPTYRYHRVDVFTRQPFAGNPVAVFPEAQGLDAREMQAIAREMNLSETVFCLPPSEAGADVQLRIFTVDRELPLAGHPTVGTFHVLASTGRFGELREGTATLHAQLKAGVLPVEVLVQEGQVDAVVMTQRTPAIGPAITDRELLSRALGLDAHQVEVGELPARVVDTGVPWLLIPVLDLPALRSMQPDPAACRVLAEVAGTDLIHAFTQETEDPSCSARTRHVYFGTVTPGEDPVTGSACGCLGAYFVVEEVVMALPQAQIAIEQGFEVGRPGRVTVLVDKEGGRISRVQAGGAAVHIGDGELRF